MTYSDFLDPLAGRYYKEPFTKDDRGVLSRFFTNLDRPVFALINLPEVVKGALFARYSRTNKSLRRLFLDEFVREADIGIKAIADQLSREDPFVNLKRAENLYRRVFDEFGDDSVAQLGGAHLACEQASNLLTKVLEWGRLAAYLEQSTRYMPYDQPLGGRYRYFIPPEVEASPFREDYLAMMDRLFDTYRDMHTGVMEYLADIYPLPHRKKDRVSRNIAIRTKSFDTIRGLLPASTVSNVGIYATGQAYEMALIRMQAHPLKEVQDYGGMMLTELRKVIPSFLTRVDRADRGVAWSNYLSETAAHLQELADCLTIEPDPASTVTLTDWDPEAERKLAAAALYSVSELPDAQLLETVDQMSSEQVTALIASLVGDRSNRRHKPGRALERSYYRFDVVCDFGAFRDLQRHRMMTIEWQPLTTRLTYDRPSTLVDAGLGTKWDDTMEEAGAFYERLRESLGRQIAQYAVPFAYKIRFMMEMNTRQALHLIELRTQAEGHSSYRDVCLRMHQQIETVAKHTRIASIFSFLNDKEAELERLESARRSAERVVQRYSAVPLPLVQEGELPFSAEA